MNNLKKVRKYRKLKMILLCLLCLLVTACSNQFAKQEYDSDEKIAQDTDRYAKENSVANSVNGEYSLTVSKFNGRQTLWKETIKENKDIEILVNYEPKMHYFIEWWKQLYGESEGNDKKGIYPSSVNLSTDLHSLGQYIQDGMRNIMETVINVENPLKDLTIKNMDGDIDGLNYLNGKTVDFVNKKAFAGTLLAHLDGGVPNMVVTIPKIDAYHIGYMIYFFEKACGISGHLAAVNPFNKEGVENYKRNMFALLGKKGFESLKNELEKRL